MANNISYEIRTKEKGEIKSKYAKSISNLCSSFKETDKNTVIGVYRIYKDDNNNVIESESLICELHGNIFSISTASNKKRKKLPPDSPFKNFQEIIYKKEEVEEQPVSRKKLTLEEEKTLRFYEKTGTDPRNIKLNTSKDTSPRSTKLNRLENIAPRSTKSNKPDITRHGRARRGG